MQASALHERLRTVAGERSYRELGVLTRTHPETVRRYMLGQSPSAEYLAMLCSALNINGEWLLTGRGPVNRRDIRADALREANATELLNAIAETLERLIGRVERLEVFLQTLETRLRSQRGEADKGVSCGHGTPEVAVPLSERARAVADAVPPVPHGPSATPLAQRAPADAGRTPEAGGA